MGFPSVEAGQAQYTSKGLFQRFLCFLSTIGSDQLSVGFQLTLR